MRFRERYRAWYVMRSFDGPHEVAIYLLVMYVLAPVVIAWAAWFVWTHLL